MNFGSFLFGNLDESGRLENDEFDNEIKESLSKFAMNQSGTKLFSSLIDDRQEGDDASVNNEDFGEDENEAGNTLDEVDEVAEEVIEEDENEEDESQSVDSADNYENNHTEINEVMDIYDIFPSFTTNKILNFSTLFSLQSTKRPLQLKKSKIKKGAIDELALDLDDEDVFRLSGLEYASYMKSKMASASRITLFQGNSNQNQVPQQPNRNTMIRRHYKQKNFEKLFEMRKHQNSDRVDCERAVKKNLLDEAKMNFVPLMITNWEDDIIWDEDSVKKRPKQDHLMVGIEEEVRRHTYFPRPDQPPRPIQTQTVRVLNTNAAKFLNFELEKSEWEDSIIWDDTILPPKLPSMHPVLSMNDPNLIFETFEIENLSKKLFKAEKLIAKRLKKLRKAKRLGISAEKYIADSKPDTISFLKPLADKFNLSNDKFYEKVEAKVAPIVKSNLRQIGVQHSIPALKLSEPYFKNSLSKEESRNFHRPTIKFPMKSAIHLSMLKKKSEVGKKNVGEVIRHARKLTLRDNSDFVLIEYSEECPLLMMNSGMASLLIQYYRKSNSSDRYESKTDEIGEQVILEPSDQSPFLAIGDVKAGQQQYCLNNNLFRAPLFKHEPNYSDFLMIKYSFKGEVKYYLREIPVVFVSGQTIPLVEVFGPHSRKFNLYCKNRLLVAAYRMFKKEDNDDQKLKISKLLDQFPQFSEGSVRKWLKEYAESVRKGRDSGWWKLKSSAPNYSEDDLRKLVTPEMVCQYESMQAGQQRLIDAGLISALDQISEDFDDLDDDSILDDEVKNAPWITTRNMISASLGKTQLQLNPHGDPTGRGEGFAFQRASNKKTFDSPSKRPNTKSEVNLKEEIAKIWKLQFESLSNKNDVPVDDLELSQLNQQSNQTFSQGSVASRNVLTDSVPISRNDSGLLDDDAMSVTSLGSKRANRTLIITRTINLPNGDVGKQEEVIKDPRIINAYLRQKQLNEVVKKPVVEEAVKKERKRETKGLMKCGSCGSLGHMRTNRACPNFVEDSTTTNNETESKKKKIPKGKDQSQIRKKFLNDLTSILFKIWKDLASTPHSYPFHKPVNPKQVADYYTFVTNPMDLSSIRLKLKKLSYSSAKQFCQDVKLMKDNCEKYNGNQHSLTLIITSMYEKTLNMVEQNQEIIDNIENQLDSLSGSRELFDRQDYINPTTEKESSDVDIVM